MRKTKKNMHRGRSQSAKDFNSLRIGARKEKERRKRERKTTRSKIEKDRKEEVCDDFFKRENGMGKKKVKMNKILK